MKQALLATVAVAALAIGGLANAQDRGDMRSQATPPGAASGDMTKGGAEKPDKAAPRAAQSEPNRGAAQSGHETGQQRAQDQRSNSGPNHETGRARAEERRPDQAPNRTGAAESQQDKSKSQAQQQQDKKSAPANRTGAAEGDKTRSQAQENRSAPNNRTGANDAERRGGAGATQRSGSSDPAMSAQPNRTGANEQRGSAQDRQGNTARSNSGGDVNVTGSIRVDSQKASRVHDELIRTAPRQNINISVSVGQQIPSSVRVRPVPSSIISISPEFRGYSYVVIRDEIVIVEPKTKKVVTVIQSGGGSHRAQRASFSLNSQQKSRIRSDIRMENARNFDVEVREGRAVPQTVVLERLPEVIVREVPEVRDYRYFVDDRRIVIVDPDTREVVDIID